MSRFFRQRVLFDYREPYRSCFRHGGNPQKVEALLEVGDIQRIAVKPGSLDHSADIIEDGNVRTFRIGDVKYI